MLYRCPRTRARDTDRSISRLLRFSFVKTSQQYAGSQLGRGAGTVAAVAEKCRFKSRNCGFVV